MLTYHNLQQPVTSNGFALIKHPTGVAVPYEKQAEPEPKNIFFGKFN